MPRADRRGAHRVNYHLPVRVEYFSLDAGAREEQTNFINISESGCYLPLESHPDDAKTVRLKILAPKELSSSFVHPDDRRSADPNMQMVIMASGSIVRAVEDPARPRGICVGVRFQDSIRIAWEKRNEA